VSLAILLAKQPHVVSDPYREAWRPTTSAASILLETEPSD